MKLKNRFKVEMRGNAPVVYDTKRFKTVQWFGDVLKDASSRRRAQTLADELNRQEDPQADARAELLAQEQDNREAQEEPEGGGK